MNKEILDYLYNLAHAGMKLGLGPIKLALKTFGNPERKMKIIHVGGTNGKGSVVAMVSSILREAGYSVGMYTSPHLIDYRERIQLNGRKIPNKDFIRIFNKIKKKKLSLSFFEFTNLLALLYFEERKTDYVVLEVGMGGRLDSTNAGKAMISVITDISLDHEKFLGGTLELITRDKCEIIKPKIPVITSNNESPVIDIIKEVCAKRKCSLTISSLYKGEISLKGGFQKRNAGVAVEIAKRLKIKGSIIKQGLKKVKWPARAQFIEKNIVFDGAHNPAGIKAISEYVSSLDYKDLIVVFGVKQGKKYEKMLKLLPKYKTLIITRSGITSALDPREIKIDCLKIPDYM